MRISDWSSDVCSSDLNAPAPFYFPRYSTSSNIAYYGDNTILQLPVYVCPRETQGACTAANGTLNPNNPYADQGQTAAVIGRLPNLTEHNRSEEHTSELQSLMRISYAVFCLKKKTKNHKK